MGTIFNAANEVAVENFLNGRIKFDEIYEVIYRTFDSDHLSNDLNIDSINEVNIQTRNHAEKVLKSIA